MIAASPVPGLAYSAPWPLTLLALVGAAAAVGAGIWLTTFLIRRIERIFWRRQTVIRQVRILNSGNVPGVIQFTAVAPGDELSFQYWLDGRPLLPLTPAPLPEPEKAISSTLPRPAPSAAAAPEMAAPVQPAPAAAA